MKVLSILHIVLPSLVVADGILYPRQSESREILSLDGIWNFVIDPSLYPSIGLTEEWYKDDLAKLNGSVELMPVPSSYNDITQNSSIRDHVGSVWYDRTFFVSKDWSKKRVWLRFSSVFYYAKVWINGKFAMKHEIGHLPFQADVGNLLNFYGINRITVVCNNTLSESTIPQGNVTMVKTDDGEELTQSYNFDFFNYAGIHRPVTLYTTPLDYIDDITVKTFYSGHTENKGMVYYDVHYVSKNQTMQCEIKLLDNKGNFVIKSQECGGYIEFSSVNLWWPYLMDPNPGYLYTMQVTLLASNGEPVDIYRQPIGIRQISWNNFGMLLNNIPVYLRGFGRHEDADIRGKGFDLPTIIRDFNLIKWVGANAFRTSHYPYSEEIMDLADQLGIMIIDEAPSVALRNYSNALLANHINALTELYKRDKNRPSVIAWSVANEPHPQKEAGPYFAKIRSHMDATTGNSIPITMSIFQAETLGDFCEHVDIISFNHYYGWYDNPGKLNMITDYLIRDVTWLYQQYNKSIIISEYGAEAVGGLHMYPQVMWTEEYQESLMSKHFEAFDRLRNHSWFMGEFIWNFADFQTKQSINRVNGNKKGIFTRARQPKPAAYLLRQRYFSLAQELDNATTPDDLRAYINSYRAVTNNHDEF